MQHSPELAAIAAALSDAQGEFESVAKDSANPFYKSRYAGLPAVIKAAAPILVSHGLSVTQMLGHDEAGDTLTTVLLHKSGEYIADTMHLRPIKDDPQAQGSAITYGRRYAYMAALGLVAEDDDDGNAASQGTRAKPKKAPAKPTPSRRPEPDPMADRPGALESPDDISPDSKSPIGAPVLDKLRAQFEKSGWSEDKLKWALVDVGADPNAGLPVAMAALSLDQAVKLMESMGGKADDLA